MAGRILFFNSVLQQLSDVCSVIEELKQKEQAVCDDLRVLLQPWPRRKDAQAPKSDDSKPQPSKVEEQPKPAEVLLVDKALAKAEKARTRFKGKVPEAYKHIQEHGAQDDNIDLPVQEMATSVLYSQPDAACTTNLHDGSLINDKHVPAISDQSSYDQAAHYEEGPTSNSVCSSQPTHSNFANSQSNLSVIPQSKLNKILSNKFSGQRKPSPTTANISASKAPRSTTSTAQLSTARSSRNKNMPVHMSAPFRTEVVVKKTKPGLTKTQMLRANANANKLLSSQGQSISKSSSAGQKIGQGLRPQKSGSGKRDQNLLDSARQRVKTFDTRHPSSATSNHGPTSQNSGRSNMVEVSHGQNIQGNLGHSNSAIMDQRLQKLSLSNLSDSIRNENTNNNANNTVEEGAAKQEQEERELPFLLKRDGAKLSLPAKLSRLITTNRKLREKLRFAGITKKAQEDVSAADHFMQRMDQYISSDFSEEQYQKLLQTRELCQSYKYLSSVFEKVCRLSLTESSDWRDVLRGKRQMEHVLLTFADLENQFLTLCSGHPVYNSVKEDSIKLEGEDCSRLFWVAKHVPPDNLSLASKVKYQNKNDVSKHTELLHRYQVLQWELHIMNETSKEIIPRLYQSAEQPDSETLQLYRCAYSMLCSCGTTFPVMVRDSDDGEQSSDDEYIHSEIGGDEKT